MMAAPDGSSDPEQPIFHVMAQRGWINDPNGPIYYRGMYHLCAPDVSLPGQAAFPLLVPVLQHAPA